MLLPTLVSFLSLASAFDPCPLSGAVFPPPTSLAGDTSFQTLAANLTASLNNAQFDRNATAYSVSIFSTEDPDLLFEWHNTPDNVRSGSYGVREITSDSVYRIASVSKLVTVYSVLVAIGDTYWEQPVTNFVEELRNLPSGRQDGVDYVQWEQVTLGDLASEMSGVTRDLQVLLGLEGGGLSGILPAQAQLLGLPPLTQDEEPPCLQNVTGTARDCDRSAFLANLDSRHPVVAANLKPVYSNTAFVILAFALESILGKSFENILTDELIKPLSLDRFFYNKPDDAIGVIPSTPWGSQWNVDVGISSPAGAFYSSTKALATIGRSILASNLISQNSTRAWLKPTAFTASMNGAVGRPWEIVRIPLYGNRVTDLYGKDGGLGSYTSYIGLLPDFGVGFTVLTAGAAPEGPVSNIVADVLVPGLEEIARTQSEQNFGGRYAASGGTNSSITFTTQAGMPGLGVSEWVSNGTDLIATLPALYSSLAVEIRVYPTGLQYDTSDGHVQYAWRGVPEVIPQPVASGPLKTCRTWTNLDNFSYGRNSIDEILFVVDEEGKAVSVEPRAFKTVLRRVE